MRIFSNKKHGYIAAIFIFVAILIVGSILFFKSPQAPAAVAPKILIPVVTAPVTTQIAAETVRIKAITRPWQETNITTPIAGIVQAIHFKAGQLLQQGDLILQLDATVPRAQLQKAEAQFKYQDTNLNKYKQLLKTNVVARIEVERLQAERDQALAAVHELEANLAQYTLKAPFTAKAGLSNIALGQYLVPGNTVVHLSDATKLLVDFPVAEKYINHLKNLEQVHVVADNQQSLELMAKIIAIDDQFVSNTHMLKVRALLDNSTAAFTAGNFVTVYLPIQAQQKLLSVPAAALIFNANGTFVYVENKGTAHLQQVELSHVNDDQALIVKGLEPNQQVVVSGQINLHEGAALRVTNNSGKI